MRPRFVLWLNLLLTIASGVASLPSCTSPPSSEPFPGVRLGMTPRDVRDRFEVGSEGSWQTKLGGGAGASDDTVLEWRASSDKTQATSARFEFHLGMLVAIRARLREGLAAEQVEATPKTVTLRSPGAAGLGGTEVTVLARDCPTHHEEAESLVVKASK